MADGDPTQRLTPFEAQVLQRFDKMEAGQVKIKRLDGLEARTFDTKPIWSQVLTELRDMRAEMREMKTATRNVERKIRVLHDDLLGIKADLRDFDERLAVLEAAKPG